MSNIRKKLILPKFSYRTEFSKRKKIEELYEWAYSPNEPKLGKFITIIKYANLTKT